MTTKVGRIADSAGVLGAIVAALCCFGAHFLVAGFAAVGLSFLHSDPLLWPLMLLSLLVAMWGMWRGWRMHGSAGPLLVALVAGAALIAGAIFVRGMPERVLIYAGSVGLIGASIWNVSARARRARAS